MEQGNSSTVQQLSDIKVWAKGRLKRQSSLKEAKSLTAEVHEHR
jgi:hypothetical protein